MPKFKQIPIEVQAVQWIGTEDSFKEIQDFLFNAVFRAGTDKLYYTTLWIPGIISPQMVELDDWIIKDQSGAHTVLSNTKFKSNYEIIEDTESPTLTKDESNE